MNDDLSLDDFPCGLVVTTVDEHKIIATNTHFHSLCERVPDLGAHLFSLFTPTSQIMIESFVMPMLLVQRHCEEIQLTIEAVSAKRIPVLVNARMHLKDKQRIYWVINGATRRDSLYQELVDLRNDWEDRAEELEVLSQTDELTGLLNRRAFKEQANRTIKQAISNHLLYSFFMIDIDNFKAINDQYGHDVGDIILREVSNLLRRNCRDNDILARLGGEEFAIFTLSQTAEASLRFADKLLNVISANKIHGLDITVSIGLAMSKQAQLKEIAKSADTLLYQAKANGKNRTVSHQGTLPAPARTRPA